MNKTELLKFYNIYKILKTKDLARLSKTYKDNSQTVIVMFKKKSNKPDILIQILNELKDIKSRLCNVEQSITTISSRINNLVEKNNLIE